MTDLIETLLDLAEISSDDIPAMALSAAQLSLFDWVVCGRAGITEPVSKSLHAFSALEGGQPVASIFGAEKAPARMAAMANGTISHAIDFDDTHFAHIGHLSVGIYPAALAVGEATGATAADVICAFLTGAEAAIRVGTTLGAVHYNRGFHQTATAGAFGATLAAGRLLGLSRYQMRMALGLCSTRASGVKSQFGTMGKPLNAGYAAANGVEAAQLALLGMTSCEDGLQGKQGFISTHSDVPTLSFPPLGEWLFPDVSYKFHACCHGTHAMIEALLGIAPLDPTKIEHISISTALRWLSVCNIENPATGLEVKFSYRWLAAMVLTGKETGNAASYTDTLAHDPILDNISRLITVSGADHLSDMHVEGTVTMIDGSTIGFSHDLTKRLEPNELQQRLVVKAQALLGDAAKELSPILQPAQNMLASDLGRYLRAGK